MNARTAIGVTLALVAAYLWYQRSVAGDAPPSGNLFGGSTGDWGSAGGGATAAAVSNHQYTAGYTPAYSGGASGSVIN